MNAIPFQFPPGEILDRDGFTWLTLPPDTRIAQSRIHGVCSCDPSQLRLAQVTIERGDWKLNQLWEEKPFPLAVGFPIAVPGTELDVRSTSEAPVRITVRVRRTTGVPRDERDQIVSRLEPVTFHLVLVARGAEELSI